MAAPKLKYGIGNAASTTTSSSMTTGSTSTPLTSSTNFQSAPTPGEGTILIDEGNATEEIAYATAVSGGNLTTPLANRGLEGGSAQAHSSGATVKGVVTVGMWNDVITALLNVLSQSTGAVDTTKVVTLTASQTLTNKTLTTPILGGDTNLSTSTGNFTVAGSDPKRSFYVPAAAMFGATTNGAAQGQIETTTNKINSRVLDFDAATEEYAWFAIPSPDLWDLSTITVKFHWTAASGSGDVIWGLAGLARSDDDALDTAVGTAQEVTDTLLSANDQHTTSATSAITIGGTPAKGDYIYLRAYRKAAAGGDTLAVDARLIGITVKFNMGQYDDQ